MFSSFNLSAFSVETLQPIALWATLGLLAAALICGTLLFFLKKDAFRPFCKYAFFAFAAYLTLLALAFFFLDAFYHYSEEYAEENWLNHGSVIRLLLLPVFGVLLVIVISVISYLLVAKYREQAKPIAKTVCFGATLVSLIVALVCLGVYYQKHIHADGYYNSDSAQVKQLALYLCAALLTALLIFFFSLEKEPLSLDSKSLAYAGVCIAMSFALSYIKVWDMPAGGSVTVASLLPLSLYAYAFGLKRGLFAAFVYSILQAVQDPWLIHPAQFLLDYPVAFTGVGLAGLFKKIKTFERLPQLSFALGTTLVGTFRFIAHVLSGVFAFEAYAEGQNALLYSLAYNVYVFVDIAIVVALGAALLSSTALRKTFETAAQKN
ncbi:MAG: energy-coupled thiamine transporter ThiT [Clostridia bacterium]|nr:energy-coupled thiamine transporter ThiT [Clostridia bacterium]